MGLKLNLHQSTIFFSKLAKDSQQFCRLLNIQQGSFSIQYLGIPLVDGPYKYVQFNDLLKKVSRWLKGWKCNFLYGDRLQLLLYSLKSYARGCIRLQSIHSHIFVCKVKFLWRLLKNSSLFVRQPSIYMTIFGVKVLLELELYGQI